MKSFFAATIVAVFLVFNLDMAQAQAAASASQPLTSPAASRPAAEDSPNPFVVFAMLAVAAAVIGGVALRQKRLRDSTTPEQRQEQALTEAHGQVNSLMLCPHCQTKGGIRTRSVSMKKGVSGGKAVAALMTAGLSTMAVGLSRKERLTKAWCGNCHNTWIF